MKSAASSLALVALLAFAGCGGDDEKGSGDTTASPAAQSTAAQTPPLTATQPPASQVTDTTPAPTPLPAAPSQPSQSGGTPAQPSTPAPSAPGSGKIVKQADVINIDLGTTRAVILKRFGKPIGTPSNGTQTCLVYATDAGGDTWERFCFVKGKLTSIATVIGRDNALTLTPPPLKGPGTLKHGDTGKPPKPPKN